MCSHAKVRLFGAHLFLLALLRLSVHGDDDGAINAVL
jgi:hypothetical protein